MIYDFIDMSMKYVDAVDTSQKPPAEREEQLAADIGSQPPFDVVEQFLFVTPQLAARLVERAPCLVAPSLERLDLALEPKLLGKTGRKSGGLLRFLDAGVQLVERHLQAVAPVARPAFELLDLHVEPPAIARIQLLEDRELGVRQPVADGRWNLSASS